MRLGSDRRGGDHMIGPGLAELLLRAGLLGPGDDHELGSQLASRQRDEHVGGVVGHGRDEHAGALDSRFLQDRLFGRVAHQVQIPSRFHRAASVVIQVDDHERNFRAGQTLANEGSDPAESGHDRVIRSVSICLIMRC